MTSLIELGCRLSVSWESKKKSESEEKRQLEVGKDLESSTVSQDLKLILDLQTESICAKVFT